MSFLTPISAYAARFRNFTDSRTFRIAKRRTASPSLGGPTPVLPLGIAGAAWTWIDLSLTNQKSQPRKHKLPRRIVNHIHLARVEPGLELRQWNIQLNGGSTPVWRIDLVHFDGRALVDLHVAPEKRGIRHKSNGGFLLLVGICGPLCVIDLIVEIELLVLGEDVCDARN